jgi:TrmH RNA methyltransferase
VPLLDPAQAETVAPAWARERKLLLMLDGIGNPHNLGAIVRTAAFFGLSRIVLSDHPAQALPSDASYRVAEGGLEFVELYRAQRFAQVLARLRKSHRLIAAAAEAGQPLATLSKSDKPFALILGNEERGLSRATLDACDAIVTIPGAGHVQSLNVAASAAILIHALA